MDLSLFERRLRDAEANKREAEAEKARQERLCHQLTEANDQLSQSAVNAAKDLEREKTLIRSQYEEELNELRKRLRDGDDDMESVRVHEQNQRLQLLDEVSLEEGCFFEQTRRLIFCTCSSIRHKKRSTSSTCSYELEADDSVRWHTCIPNGGNVVHA